MPIADYKQFLNLRAGRDFHLGYYPPHAANTSALYAEPTVGLPNQRAIRCGACDRPYLQHPVVDPFGEVLCSRRLSDFTIDSDFDYYVDTFTSVKDSQPGPYYNEDDSETADVDYDHGIDKYSDQYPDEFTSATHWWTKTKPATAYAAGTRQATGNLPVNAGTSSKGTPVVIDGSTGFTSVQVFDPETTERYALRSLLNYYVDANTGDTRLGGLVLKREGSLFTAKCVRNDWTTNRCASKALSIDLDAPDLTREVMEDFVLNVIRHGNNHAAIWFTKRSTFYKVHHSDCDLLCDANLASCDTANAEERRLSLLLSELAAQYAHVA